MSILKGCFNGDNRHSNKKESDICRKKNEVIVEFYKMLKIRCVELQNEIYELEEKYNLIEYPRVAQSKEYLLYKIEKWDSFLAELRDLIVSNNRLEATRDKIQELVIEKWKDKQKSDNTAENKELVKSVYNQQNANQDEPQEFPDDIKESEYKSPDLKPTVSYVSTYDLIDTKPISTDVVDIVDVYNDFINSREEMPAKFKEINHRVAYDRLEPSDEGQAMFYYVEDNGKECVFPSKIGKRYPHNISGVYELNGSGTRITIYEPCEVRKLNREIAVERKGKAVLE